MRNQCTKRQTSLLLCIISWRATVRCWDRRWFSRQSSEIIIILRTFVGSHILKTLWIRCLFLSTWSESNHWSALRLCREILFCFVSPWFWFHIDCDIFAKVQLIFVTFIWSSQRLFSVSIFLFSITHINYLTIDKLCLALTPKATFSRTSWI